MKLDTSQFPLVKMVRVQDTTIPVEQLLADIAELFKRQEHFVFINEELPEPNAERTKDDRDDRRKIAMWMKDNKSELVKWALAQVQVVEDKERWDEVKQFAVISEKFWGYPMYVVSSIQEAKDKAKTLLANN